MELFRMENVSFIDASLRVVENINLKISEGTVTEFFGPSGGGKTTVLKLLAGILKPTSGKVYFRNQCIETMTRAEELKMRKECAFVFQDCALWSNQSILQNLMLPLMLHYPSMDKLSAMEKIEQVCESVGYDRELTLRPANLSDGEQKKIAFARALVIDPKILLLDECTASLDSTGTYIIIDILKKFLEKNNTIIYISHNERFRMEFACDMYRIQNGSAELQMIDLDDLR